MSFVIVENKEMESSRVRGNYVYSRHGMACDVMPCPFLVDGILHSNSNHLPIYLVLADFSVIF